MKVVFRVEDVSDVDGVIKQMGQAIRTARKAKGMTQEQLEAATGLTQASISGIETGRFPPSLKTFFKLAEILDIAVEVGKGVQGNG